MPAHVRKAKKIASTEMKPYFCIHKWLNKVQGIKDPETNLNNAMCTWVQCVINNKGRGQTTFLKGKLSPELGFTQVQKSETSHAEETSTEKTVE